MFVVFIRQQQVISGKLCKYRYRNKSWLKTLINNYLLRLRLQGKIISFRQIIKLMYRDLAALWIYWYPGWGPGSNFFLIRLSRPKLSLIRLSRRKLTLIRLSRPKLPLIRLSRHKGSLIRLFRPKAFWSDHLQTMVQTQIQTLIRLWSDSEVMVRPSCARSHLWSDWSALEASSDQTQVHSK